MKRHADGGEWVTNGCSSGKRAFRQRKDAKKVAGQMRRDGSRGMSVYLCAECEQFHIGHMPKEALRGEMPRTEIVQPGDNNPTRKKQP